MSLGDSTAVYFAWRLKIMQNNSLKVIFSIGWCLLIYFLAFKNNPGYLSILVLATMFVVTNIYYYIYWKLSKPLSLIIKLISIVMLLIYAILINGLIMEIFPPIIMDYLKMYSSIALRIYLMFIDLISMLFAIIVLSPMMIFIYRSHFKNIAMLLSVIIIVYPLLFSPTNKFAVVIGVVSANMLGSLLAINLTTCFMSRKKLNTEGARSQHEAI